MKQFILIIFFLITAVLIQSTFANSATELYVVWAQKPITIQLPTKVARTLKFVNPVSVGLPARLKGKLQINNQAGVVNFTVEKPFAATRIEVKDTTTNQIMVLIVSTADSASNATLSVLYQAPTNAYQPDNQGWIKTPTPLQGELAYVTLTRYAEQALYAPHRLQKNPYGIALVTSYLTPGGGIKSSNLFHTLFYDNSTINIPWASWRGGNSYVTAVLVRNTLSEPLDLTKNLPMLCGHDDGVFKAVTFFPHWQLSKAGTENDTTVAFLVSKKPFQDAQKSCEVANG